MKCVFNSIFLLFHLRVEKNTEKKNKPLRFTFARSMPKLASEAKRRQLRKPKVNKRSKLGETESRIECNLDPIPSPQRRCNYYDRFTAVRNCST